MENCACDAGIRIRSIKHPIHTAHYHHTKRARQIDSKFAFTALNSERANIITRMLVIRIYIFRSPPEQRVQLVGISNIKSRMRRRTMHLKLTQSMVCSTKTICLNIQLQFAHNDTLDRTAANDVGRVVVVSPSPSPSSQRRRLIVGHKQIQFHTKVLVRTTAIIARRSLNDV